MTVDLFLVSLQQGLVLAIIAYAVMIPFRILNFPDLTSEGAYPMGGAVCATILLLGLPLPLAIVLGILSSCIIAIGTSLIHLRFRVNTLLAGIILSAMCYSINLRIMGKPNVPLFHAESIFNQNIITNILILLAILILIISALSLFLRTDFGLKLRAVGLNSDFAQKYGITVHGYTIFGLFLAGCFSGLAGSLMVQLQSYMDVGMGVGILIHGLAGLMIGEAVLGNNTINKQLLAPFIGALLYQQVQGIAISLGLAPSDLKLFTGFIILIVIAMRSRRS